MIAGVHTHQLADHVSARGTDMEQSRWPSPEDEEAAGVLKRPEIVVSRTVVTMTWVGEDGKTTRLAQILRFAGPDALRRGDVTVTVPPSLQGR